MSSNTSATRTEIEIVTTEQPDPTYYTPEECAAIVANGQAANAAMQTRIALRNARNRRRLARGMDPATLARLDEIAAEAAAAHVETSARLKITRRRLGELLGAKRRAQEAARLSPPAP